MSNLILKIFASESASKHKSNGVQMMPPKRLLGSDLLKKEMQLQLEIATDK